MREKQRPIGLVLIAAFLTVLPSASLMAQEYRGRIQGTVTDSSQGAIVGAQVTLLNSKTGVAAVRQTNENGHYLFDLVEPGTYSIAVEFQGFNRFVQENTAVPSRADLTVNAVLKPGEIKETISVTAEAATLQFNTSKLETTVDNKLTQSTAAVISQCLPAGPARSRSRRALPGGKTTLMTPGRPITCGSEAADNLPTSCRWTAAPRGSVSRQVMFPLQTWCRRSTYNKMPLTLNSGIVPVPPSAW